jgi:hypothetical protein
MSRTLAATLVIGLAALAAAPASAQDKEKEKEKKAKRPMLELRISPRFSFSPVNILFTAELTGGDDSEEYHCPEIEWDWNDGGKSVTEADCDPYEAGMKMERRFTASHLYKMAGSYLVKVTLRKAGRQLTQQTIRVTVRPGAGDPSEL